MQERVVGGALLEGGLVGEDHLEGDWGVGEVGVDDWEAQQVGDWGGEVQFGGLELLEQAD